MPSSSSSDPVSCSLQACEGAGERGVEGLQGGLWAGRVAGVEGLEGLEWAREAERDRVREGGKGREEGAGGLGVDSNSLYYLNSEPLFE